MGKREKRKVFCGPEERRALREMDYRRKQEWIRTGQLVEFGPRKYLIKL